MRSFIIAALAALALAAPAAGQVTGDTASVQAFYGRWFGSATQGPDAYASFYAPTARSCRPTPPRFRGGKPSPHG